MSFLSRSTFILAPLLGFAVGFVCLLSPTLLLQLCFLVALVSALLLSLCFLLTRVPALTSPAKNLQAESRSWLFWFGANNLIWILISSCMMFFLLALFGPMPVIPALMAGLACSGLIMGPGMVPLWRQEMLALCWQVPSPLSWRSFFRDAARLLFLKDRFQLALELDHQREMPFLPAMTRLLDQAAVGGSGRGISLRRVPAVNLIQENLARLRVVGVFFGLTSLLWLLISLVVPLKPTNARLMAWSLAPLPLIPTFATGSDPGHSQVPALAQLGSKDPTGAEVGSKLGPGQNDQTANHQPASGDANSQPPVTAYSQQGAPASTMGTRQPSESGTAGEDQPGDQPAQPDQPWQQNKGADNQQGQESGPLGPEERAGSRPQQPQGQGLDMNAAGSGKAPEGQQNQMTGEMGNASGPSDQPGAGEGQSRARKAAEDNAPGDGGTSESVETSQARKDVKGQASGTGGQSQGEDGADQTQADRESGQNPSTDRTGQVHSQSQAGNKTSSESGRNRGSSGNKSGQMEKGQGAMVQIELPPLGFDQPESRNRRDSKEDQPGSIENARAEQWQQQPGKPDETAEHPAEQIVPNWISSLFGKKEKKKGSE